MQRLPRKRGQKQYEEKEVLGYCSGGYDDVHWECRYIDGDTGSGV